MVETEHAPAWSPSGAGTRTSVPVRHEYDSHSARTRSEARRKEATITRLQRGEQPGREGGAVDAPAGHRAERSGLLPQLLRERALVGRSG